MNRLTEKSREYLGYGLSVVLLREGKGPALTGWKDLQTTPLTAQEVEELVAMQTIRPTLELREDKKDREKVTGHGIKAFTKPVGVGIITGTVSGNLEVVDVDTKHDTTGTLWEDLRGLLEDHLPDVLARMVIARTVSGGYHLYYRLHELQPEGNLKLANKDNGDVLIETRGEGGYVVAFPSEGYSFIQGDPSGIPTLSTEERDMILGLARSFNQKKEKPRPQPRPAGEAYTGEDSPFEDYYLRGDVVGLLEAHGWKVVRDRGDRVDLLRPGQTDSKTSGNFHTGLRIFYNFSTSSPGLDTGKYTPGQLFSALECNGDSKEAYRRLLDRGYGKKPQKDTPPPPPVPTRKVKVDQVNLENGEVYKISAPGQMLATEDIQITPGEYVRITSPGWEAVEEVLKAMELVEASGKRVYIFQDGREIRSPYYRLWAILRKYGIHEEREAPLEGPGFDSMLDEVVETGSSLAPMDQDIYREYFISLPGIQSLGVREESLRVAMDRITATREKEEQSQELRKLVDDLKDLQGRGETQKALELMEKGRKRLELVDKKKIFSGLRDIPTEEQIKKHFSKVPDHISSGYHIGDTELLLPSGGLTGIAGPTNHGKTDLLINMTLNAVRGNPEKEFYFFTYEMSQEAILVRFLNSWLDMDLEISSNQRAIKTYFKSGNTKYIKSEAREPFLREKDAFFRDLISTGRLRVKGVDLLAPELNQAMEELARDPRTGAFFIDYFQLLKLPKEGYKNYSRQEELKTICIDLNETAKRVNLPIILGAQFNREVTTPFRIHATNIGEAGDIERILDTLVGIWYTSKKMVEADLRSNKEDPSPYRKEDRLYINVLKSRETESGIYTFLEYSGKRGVIKNSGEDLGGPPF